MHKLTASKEAKRYGLHSLQVPYTSNLWPVTIKSRGIAAMRFMGQPDREDVLPHTVQMM